MKARACELCSETAALYCASDSAYLCWSCDARVHGANFLVARHLRRTICAECEGFDGNCISGVVTRPFTPVCRSCSSESLDDDVDSMSSSVCVSSTESFATSPKKVDLDRRRVNNTSSSIVTGITDLVPVSFSGETTSPKRKKSRAGTKTKSPMRSRASAKVDGKVECVLVNWCRMLGLNGNLIVRRASHAFGLCLTELTVLPFRVALASSFWLSLKLCGCRAAVTRQNLKRLEDVSGVPAKLIISAEAKLARILRDMKSRRDDQEEGWAECSN